MIDEVSASGSVVSSKVGSRLGRAFRWSVIVCGLMVVGGEMWRWSDPNRRLSALFGSLAGDRPDWFPFLPLFVVFPWLWWRSPTNVVAHQERELADHRGLVVAWLASVLVGGIAFGMSRGINREFSDADGHPFPPAYHDEYSYWLQAETFLEGQTWLPAPGPRPEFYNQMHVLNEGRFASRYFPGVGAWLAPFVAWGDPWVAQQAAHAICAMIVFWIGRHLRDNVGGFIAGTLFALSPGLVIFSTLILAHHATLVGLLVFTWAFLLLKRGIELRSTLGPRLVGCALVAGSGLAFAMLCRPMTAAGVGLPFGLWFAWWLGTGRTQIRRHQVADGEMVAPRDIHPVSTRCAVAIALVLPLIAGIGVLLWYSSSITGDALRSPYQQYTDIYTPRHVYGFNNVVRGEQKLGPKVIDNYDRWAENLRPSLAAKNVGTRTIASLRLTLGIVPLVFSLLYLLLAGRLQGDLVLICTAIVSLHLVHVPYWYAGIMDWHYVLESAPFWLLLCGSATSDLVRWSRIVGVAWPRLWWGSVLAVAVAVNTLTIPLTASKDEVWSLWQGRIPGMLPEFRFARGTYAHVSETIDDLRGNQPAVLLVLPDPADRSLDFVTNRPSQWPQVLRVRVPADEQTQAGLAAIAALFPDRMPLVLDSARRDVSSLRSWTATAR